MSPRLLRAYRMTVYEADGIAVRPGRRCGAADRMLAQHGCRSATFIGADNPCSRRHPAGWNRRARLRLDQAARRCRTLPATGSWRGWQEAHLLVLGDPRRAIRLARRFRQAAVVIIRLRQAARIVGIP